MGAFDELATSGRLRVIAGSSNISVLFCRPEKRNAIDVPTSEAIGQVLDATAADPRPLVFRSETPGMFIAGTDLEALRARTVTESLDRTNARLFQRIAEHPWPTVAVVEGWALGGGCELALACDFRITTPDAKWGLPEVRLGLVPSAGGMARLAAVAGVGVATEMILTGRRVSGDEAYRHGIAQHLVTADRLDDELEALVTELSKAAPLAQRLAKEAMRVRGDRHRMVDAAAQALCIASDDTQARIAAQLGPTSVGTA